MTIRDANEGDTPEIVSLLKKSLGEGVLPKTQEYWDWKHIQNPFGKSLVLVAEAGNQLVGVRAFMQWRFNYQGVTLKALRAVDTATHPEWQGKGIFKKLTLNLVKVAKDQGFDFIYNTPNSKSKPGYLKMGWESMGKFPIKPLITLRLLRFFDSKRQDKVDQHDDSERFMSIPWDHFSSQNFGIDGCRTAYSEDYFSWRYFGVPGIQYGCRVDLDKKWIYFFRVKKLSAFRELRICDFFLTGESRMESIQRDIQGLIKYWKIDIVTLAGNYDRTPFNSLLPNLQIGPELTFRSLNFQRIPNDWSCSIGDLELF